MTQFEDCCIVQAQANGHAPPAAAPAQAAAAVPVAMAAEAAAPKAAVADAAAAPPSDTAPTATVSSNIESHKRQADGDVEGPSAKRAKSEATDPLNRPEWLEELNTVAKFTFLEAGKVPQATGLQMLRDSFGGPKAGLRNLNYSQVSLCLCVLKLVLMLPFMLSIEMGLPLLSQ